MIILFFYVLLPTAWSGGESVRMTGTAEYPDVETCEKARVQMRKQFAHIEGMQLFTRCGDPEKSEK